MKYLFRSIFLMGLTFLVTACPKDKHTQEVEINNNSSYTFERWLTNDSTPKLVQQIGPGTSQVNQYTSYNGKAKGFLDKTPSWEEFDYHDSISISNGKILVKDFDDSENWVTFLIGEAFSKKDKIHFKFELNDSDLQ